MGRTGSLCDRGWRSGGFPVVEESIQVGPGSLRLYRRKINSFLDIDKLVDISLAELARVREDEFVFRNLVFILPSVTLCSARTDYQDFCRLVTSESYFWYCNLRSRIGNKGLRRMRRLMNPETSTSAIMAAKTRNRRLLPERKAPRPVRIMARTKLS